MTLSSGDATPDYAAVSLLWRCMEGNQGVEEPRYTTADVIHRLNPHAKVVFIMREPVDRWVGRCLS